MNPKRAGQARLGSSQIRLGSILVLTYFDSQVFSSQFLFGFFVFLPNRYRFHLFKFQCYRAGKSQR